MGAPKEVWVNSYEQHDYVYAFKDKRRAMDTLGEGGTADRYVLARPKREAVAWVVRSGPGSAGFVCAHDNLSGWQTGVSIVFAHRFEATMKGRDMAMECAHAVGGRVVKLVRPVKRDA